MDGGKGTHRGEVSIFIQLQVFTLKDLMITQRVREIDERAEDNKAGGGDGAVS
jgi:hypothetical protein